MKYYVSAWTFCVHGFLTLEEAELGHLRASGHKSHRSGLGFWFNEFGIQMIAPQILDLSNQQLKLKDMLLFGLLTYSPPPM